MKPSQIVLFRERSKTVIGKLFRIIGIETNNKYEVGYFHCTGFSGEQKNNQHDIVIIEKENGCVVVVPNKQKYYKLIP